MSMTERISTLGRLLDAVREQRQAWRLDDKKELWFRGESKDYPESLLRPELYRPRKRDGKVQPLRNIEELLDVESDLYEEFKRCADQLREGTLDSEYWDWDSYFLLQHHGGAARLLDWSDGVLMALHFAIRNPLEDEVGKDAYVYVLEPDRLNGKLRNLHKDFDTQGKWKRYIEEKKPGDGL